MNKKILILVAMWSALCFYANCNASDKLKIRIEFSVGQHWQNKTREIAVVEGGIAPTDTAGQENYRAELEREVSQRLADVLNEGIQFVDFVSDPTVATVLTLKISFVEKRPLRPGLRPSELKSTYLSFELHGLHSQMGIKRKDLDFADAGAYFTVDRKFFEEEPADVLQNHLETSANRVVEGCLEYAKLTDQIMLVQLSDSTVAVLPWKQSEIGVSAGSEFKVKSKIGGSVLIDHITKMAVLDESDTNIRDNLPAPFREGMVIKDHETEHELREIPIDSAQIEGIYIKLYDRWLSESEPAQPHPPGSFTDPDTEE